MTLEDLSTVDMHAKLEGAIQGALNDSGDMLTKEAQAQVAQKAKQRKNRLARNITKRRWSRDLSSGVMLGWENEPLPATRKSKWRGHEVRTVAAVGAILEHSGKRVLRHMESAWDAKGDAAAALLEQRVNEALDELFPR